jgi:hypothetical protein
MLTLPGSQAIVFMTDSTSILGADHDTVTPSSRYVRSLAHLHPAAGHWSIHGPWTTDWQFNKNTTPNDLRSMVNIGSTWLPVTGRTLRSSQIIGSIVCKYGKTTHYDCGILMERNFDLDGGLPHFFGTWMRVQKNGQSLTATGDSGGPWFMPTGNPATVNAYGIHKSSIATPNSSIYMAIDYIFPSHAIYMNCTPDWYC